MRPMFARLAYTALNAASSTITLICFHHLSGMRMIALAALVAIIYLTAIAVLASACGGLPAQAKLQKDRLLGALVYGSVMGAFLGIDVALSLHVSWATMSLYVLCGATGTGTVFTIVAYVWILIQKLRSAFVRQ